MAEQEKALYDDKGVYIGPYHSKEEEVESVPCGRSITTKYKDKAGVLLRQDVRIEVAEGVIATGTSQL